MQQFEQQQQPENLVDISRNADRETNKTCPSYHHYGYCLRGDDCPYDHDGDAVNVPEMEFFFEWMVGEVYLQNYKRSKYEQEEEGKHKANTEGKFSLEQERERIKVNIAIRKQMMEEEERKEKLRMEKIEKRNLELKLETERLAALKGSQEINELINEEKQEEKQLEENEPVVHNDSSSSVNLSAEQQNQSEEDQFVLGEKYKDVNWDNPRIPLSINYHVPATTRQKILEKLINAYSKKFQDVKDKAIHRQKSVIYALESELELYNKYRESSAYWLNASSFISRMGKSDVTPSNVKTQ